MPWWTWVAVGVFVVVGIAGAAVSVLIALRMFRVVRVAQATLLDSIERLAADADALALRADRAAARIEEVERRVEDVRRSADRLGVLGWALGDSVDAVRRIRQVTPRK